MTSLGLRLRLVIFVVVLEKKLNEPQDEDDIDDPEMFKHGFAPLHAYIRSMELFLKIAYRLCMEKPTWRVSKSNTIVKERESYICTTIKQKLGLRINEPLPGGGNRNDGNTGRKFFKEYKVICEITGLDVTIMERMFVILTVINSRKQIDYEAYQIYAEETRKLYVQKYGWYPLSPTIHKLLVHGGSLIKHAILPIGLCSEEAQETRNKSIRKFREFHSRKFNRLVNIEDVFLRLLLTSDPLISLSNRRPAKSSDKEFPENAKFLLVDVN